MFEIPLVLIVFNRPELTRGLLDCIRKIHPTRLFLVADGARHDRAEESEKVARTREVLREIDWPCNITKIFAEHNMGCGLRIRSGISEAFESVDRLVVLEDDCRPNEHFFRFAQCILARYEENPRVMAVSGMCSHDRVPTQQSYYFSRYAHCWGWGTWRRAWRLYDESACNWPSISISKRYENLFATEHEMAYWTNLLDRISLGRMDTWDVQWMLTCWLNNGLTVLPTKNLVSNVGFGEDATHTRGDSPLANLPTFKIGAIKHPAAVTQDIVADRESDRLLFSGAWDRPKFAKAMRSLFRRKWIGRQNIMPGTQLGRSQRRAA